MKTKISSYLALIILITLSIITRVHSLIAYDCENTNNNITVISIQDIAKCPDPELDYNETSTTAWVIQRNAFKYQKVMTCLIEVNRLIRHCGMHSHSSGVENGFSTYIHSLGESECQNVHRHRTLKFHNQEIGNIMMNGTTTASLTIVGSLSHNGNCEGGSYTENGHTWRSVTIVVTLKIRMRDYMATVNLDENKLSLENQMTCPYMEGYCVDSTFGETVWETEENQECSRLSTLYKGNVTIVQDKNNSGDKILVVESDKNIYALALIKRSSLCSCDVWQTEHPKILVMFEMNCRLNANMQILPQNTDMFYYINSKLLYIEQSYKRAIKNMYVNTVHRRCSLHREIMRNRLLLAPLSPNALSSIIKEKLGFIGRVLGEVLYIMQCTARIATIRRTINCYQELPITVNNESYFMAPTTHVIQKHAIQIECNIITPPMYLIDGRWISISPMPMETIPPTLLKPETEHKLNLNPIQPLGASGLYTQEEISRVQQTLSFNIEREAVENIVARKLSGQSTDNQGYTTINLFDTQEIKSLARNTFYSVWGWFTDVGIFMSGIIGFYVIWIFIKYVFEIVINGFAIYKTFGCGLFIIASVWSTLTMWVISTYKRQTKPKQDAEQPLQTVEVSQTDGKSKTCLMSSDVFV